MWGDIMTSSQLGLVVLCFLGGLFVLTFGLFIKQQRVERVHHQSVLRDGGSVFLGGKFFMDYAYWFLGPVERLMTRLGWSPNVISFLCLSICIGASFLVTQEMYIEASLLWFLGSAMDALDGLVARASGKASEFGAVLDSTIDRITELSLYTALAFVFRHQILIFGLVMMALWGSLLTSYISAKGEILKISLPRGWMRRAERAVYLGIALFLLPYVSGNWPLTLVLALIVLATWYSSFYRLVWLNNYLKKRN